MIQRNTSFIALALSLGLSACATDGTTTNAIDSMSGKRAATEARLSTAAAEAIAEGKTDEAVFNFEKLYKMNKKDPVTALNYAQVLRKSGNARKAQEVLSSFVTGKKSKDMPLLKNEYAATLIELGKLDEAETLLNAVLDDPGASHLHADAANLMGIALDARGAHKDAEKMFRMALDSWKGDATSVMNNLALCLASQALFDESLSTLRKALVMAPAKQEIARNIEIVSALRDAVVPTAPVKVSK